MTAPETIGKVSSELSTDAFSLHALDDLRGPRIGGGVVAEGAIEEGLELRGAAVPIDRRRGDEAVGGQIAVEEYRTKAVLDRTFAVGLAALAAIPKEEVQEIVGEDELGLVTCFRQPLADRLGQQCGVAVAAWT